MSGLFLLKKKKKKLLNCVYFVEKGLEFFILHRCLKLFSFQFASFFFYDTCNYEDVWHVG